MTYQDETVTLPIERKAPARRPQAHERAAAPAREIAHRYVPARERAPQSNGSLLPRDRAHGLANGLGWFSIGLGLTELFAGRRLARWLGLPQGENVLRAYGVREIGTGLAILATDRPAPWVWGRVAGDVVDVATLAGGYSKDSSRNGNLSLALLSVLGIAALDVLCAQALMQHDRTGRRRSRQAVHDYRDRSGFPRSPQEMRGAASDFEVPPDFRTPELLRPYPVQ